MKFISYLLIIFSSILSAQDLQLTEELLVLDILNHKNAFEILAIDNKSDTIRILSQKEKVPNKCLYTKIKKGRIYRFDLMESPSQYNNLIIRIKDEIFWKSGDDIMDFPHFVKNVKDIYIEK